jgi:hypothetical protein
MIQIILSHWATYMYLAWVLVIVVANLWLRRNADSPSQHARFPARPAEGIRTGIVRR